MFQVCLEIIFSLNNYNNCLISDVPSQSNWMDSILPQNTEQSYYKLPTFDLAADRHTSTLSDSQSFNFSPNCINYHSDRNVSGSSDKGSTSSGVFTISNMLTEQLSDSGIHSPLTISSEVTQFLEGLSSPDSELSKSNSLSDSGLCLVTETANNESNISQDHTKCTGDTNSISSPLVPELSTAKRPEESYVEMIAKCLVSSARGKVTLSEIYDYILARYPYFETAPPAWRISVRHHLSTCEGFIKVGRVPLSRGFYWAAHPNCKQDFIEGIFEKKIMRKKIGNIKPKKRERKPVQKKQASKENIEINADCCNLEEVVNTNNDLYRRLLEKQVASPVVEVSRYNTVYNRLNSLSSHIPLSSTPVRSCMDYHGRFSSSCQSPIQTYGNPYAHNSVNGYHFNGPYTVQQNVSVSAGMVRIR